MATHLLRHAHTDWNGPPKRFQGRTDVPLSKEGRLACIQAREKLTIKPDLIISSPAIRCQETARLIFPEKSIQLDERLWEIDTGYFSGFYHEEIASKYPDEWESWQSNPGEVRPGNGESLEELANRFSEALNDWGKSSGAQEILIVTHGGPIRAIQLIREGVSLNFFHSITCENLHLVTLEDLHAK